MRQSTIDETCTEIFVSSSLTFGETNTFSPDVLFAKYTQNRQSGALASECPTINTNKKFFSFRLTFYVGKYIKEKRLI